MELSLKHRKAEKNYNLINEFTFSKEKIMSVIGRDFNKSVANIVGLVALLKDETDNSDQDINTIHQYLSIEANKLNTLVKDLCR